MFSFGSFPIVPLFGLLFLGFIGGFFLESSTVLLRLWGRDMGLTMASMDILPMILFLGNLKIFWAPFFQNNILTNKFFNNFFSRNPFFSSWGSWRFWLALLFSLGAICLWALSSCRIFGPLFLLILGIFVVCRSTVDMMVMTSQMRAVNQRYWGFSESFCVNGYHLGMSLTGFFSLRANAQGVSWPIVYKILALGTLGFCVLMILSPSIFPFWSFLDVDDSVVKNQRYCQNTLPHVLPQGSKLSKKQENLHDFQEFEGSNPKFTQEERFSWSSYFLSLFSWFSLPKWGWILGLMVLYRGQDGLLMPQMNHFFLNHGFTKDHHSWIISLGLWFSILGGFLSGMAIRSLGYKKTLWFSCIFHSMTWGILWCFFSFISPEGHLWNLLLPWGYFLQYFASGLSLIAFYSLQILCVQKEKALTQLSLMTSVNYFGFYIFGLRSGWLVDTLGWHSLFMVSFCCLPLLWLMIYKTFTISWIMEKI